MIPIRVRQKIILSDQRPETRDQRPETRDQRPETRDQRPETRDQRPETRDQRPETRDQRVKGSHYIERQRRETGRNTRWEQIAIITAALFFIFAVLIHG